MQVKLDTRADLSFRYDSWQKLRGVVTAGFQPSAGDQFSGSIQAGYGARGEGESQPPSQGYTLAGVFLVGLGLPRFFKKRFLGGRYIAELDLLRFSRLCFVSGAVLGSQHKQDVETLAVMLLAPITGGGWSEAEMVESFRQRSDYLLSKRLKVVQQTEACSLFQFYDDSTLQLVADGAHTYRNISGSRMAIYLRDLIPSDLPPSFAQALAINVLAKARADPMSTASFLHQTTAEGLAFGALPSSDVRTMFERIFARPSTGEWEEARKAGLSAGPPGDPVGVDEYTNLLLNLVSQPR
ncbi:MAG: hypothetical protein WEB00_04555 [Dehalococcoidia bacterium]